MLSYYKKFASFKFFLTHLMLLMVILVNFVSCRKNWHSPLSPEKINLIEKKIKPNHLVSFDIFFYSALSNLSPVELAQDLARHYKQLGVSPGDALDPRSVSIYRLLGMYNRLKYKDQQLDLLKKLINQPTFRVEGREQFQNPGILKTGEILQAFAKTNQLEFKNIDNRIFEVILKGKSNEDFGIYTHADTVPPILADWVLPDGQKLEPLQMQILGDKIYGLGSEDDKSSIVAALFAMKTIRENQFALMRNIRLLIETTEETTSEGIEYYKKKYALPNYNAVLDSKYPVVVAEKGFGTLMFSIPVSREKINSKAPQKKILIRSVSGGAATNQIPEYSLIELVFTPDLNIFADLKQKVDEFIQRQKTQFKVNVKSTPQGVSIQVLGESAHASEPQNGLNPVSRAYAILDHLNQYYSFVQNEYWVAAQIAAATIGVDDYGWKMKINFTDSFMGPLTATLTFSQMDAKKENLQLAVNLRLPKGRAVEEVKKQIESFVTDLLSKKFSGVSFSLKLNPPMVRNGNARWIRTLVSIFNENTGQFLSPVSSAGATTAQSLPNAVNFGPSLPGKKYRGHTANEYKELTAFRLDVQLFTEMLLRLGNMPDLD